MSTELLSISLGDFIKFTDSILTHLIICNNLKDYFVWQLKRERVMKSFIPKEKDMQKRWHVVDADGQILGRLATRVATLLTGKNKPVYTPFLDTGDHVTDFAR